MNTLIEFLYRDACNYKVHNSCVIEGQLSDEQAQVIRDSLDGGEYFIPEQVGLSAERFTDITEDDHCWCELYNDFYKATDEAPTESMTVEQLVAAFAAAKGNWDEVKYALCPDY